MESAATIASSATAKIFVQVPRRFIARIVWESKPITRSFMEGLGEDILAPTSTYTIAACQNK